MRALQASVGLPAAKEFFQDVIAACEGCCPAVQQAYYRPTDRPTVGQGLHSRFQRVVALAVCAVADCRFVACSPGGPSLDGKRVFLYSERCVYKLRCANS
eukprot:TRINITY_DN4139_c0_g1_i3.p2 TRINITY_DN4139_c0_g1~~TRINITY_DN4139_c0_g1_i3.p2  ORF type:complete len:116 (-),score=4.82 TRINITY_DN4139_c0_g1_i3:40-339(-)